MGTNATFPIELAALNSAGANVAANATMEIYLLEYQTVLEKTDEGLRYVSKKKEKLIKSHDLKFGTKNITQNFVPKISGEYEIRVKPTDVDRLCEFKLLCIWLWFKSIV